MPGGRPKKPKPVPHERKWKEGSVRQLPSGRWQGVRPRDATTGKRQTRTFSAKAQAEAWARGAVTPDALTLGVWLNRWLALRWPLLRLSTQDNYRRHIAACAPMADRPLADLTVDDWQGLTNTLLGRWSRERVRVWRQCVGAALNHAVRTGVLVRNPLKDVRLPRAVDAPPKAWRRDEVARLVAASAGDPHETWFLLALGTGARIGELRALTWADVDLVARTIAITKSLHNTRRIIGPTKTGKHRTVDLPDALVTVLTAHRARQRPGATLVCGNVHDRAFAAPTYFRAVRRICARAGVRRLPVHSLRHSAASLMLTAGVSPAEVAAQLGHSVQMLLSTYSHLINAGERRGAAALNAAFLPAPEPLGVENGASASG